MAQRGEAPLPAHNLRTTSGTTRRFAFAARTRCSARQKGLDEFIELIRGFGRAEMANTIENMKLSVGEPVGQRLGIRHRSLAIELTHDDTATMMELGELGSDVIARQTVHR